MTTIASFRAEFIKQLLPVYPAHEADSISLLAFEHLLGFSRVEIARNKDFEIEREKLLLLNNILQRLLKQEPIQYVLGEAHFYGLTFKVNPAVLIPRPETEELVHWILNDHKQNNSIRLLDIGTGSGCIPIALKKNQPAWEVVSIDISNDALEVAKENAAINDVEVRLEQCDVLQLPVTSLQSSVGSQQYSILNTQYSLLVSNPPYVLDSEKALMKKNVLDHEPHTALFVKDTDPLIFYKAIADLALKVLEPGGVLYFEINEGKGPEMIEMLTEKGFKNIEMRRDLQGVDRMVKAKNVERKT